MTTLFMLGLTIAYILHTYINLLATKNTKINKGFMKIELRDQK